MSSSLFSVHASLGTALALNQSEIFGDSNRSDFKRNFISANLYKENAASWLNSGKLLLKDRIQCRAVAMETKLTFLKGEKFQLHDVIEAQQFDRDILSAIFEVAREMEMIEKNSLSSRLLNGYLMSTLFYEPSTRTRLSFESAMKRLGGEVLTTENAREFSSAAKGETLEGS